jgi:hypothetical protein
VWKWRGVAWVDATGGGDQVEDKNIVRCFEEIRSPRDKNEAVVMCFAYDFFGRVPTLGVQFFQPPMPANFFGVGHLKRPTPKILA